jgi:AraC-like DNA-binding protein
MRIRRVSFMDYTKITLNSDRGYGFKHGKFNSSQTASSHVHNCYEIIHFINFSGNYSVEGHVYEFNNNDILITNPSELHKAMLPPNTIYESHQLLLREAFLAEFILDDYNPFRGLKYRGLGYHNKITSSVVKQHRLDALFNQIAWYHDNAVPESRVMLKSLCLQLLTHVNNIVTIEPNKKESHNIIQDILVYINTNLTERITLQLLEERFNISRYYISRLFKQQTGYTFVEYITLKRIHIAKELMLNGMYASEAALEAGFGDYSNFYRAFKHSTGMSPYDYMAQLKNDLF